MPLPPFFLHSVGLALLTLQNSQDCKSVRLKYWAEGRAEVNLTLGRYDGDCPALLPQYRFRTTGGAFESSFEVIDSAGGDILNKSKEFLLRQFEGASPVQVQITFTNTDSTTTQTRGDSEIDRVLF